MGRWIGYILLGILFLLVLVYFYANRQYKKTKDTAFVFPPVNIEIPF